MCCLDHFRSNDLSVLGTAETMCNYSIQYSVFLVAPSLLGHYIQKMPSISEANRSYMMVYDVLHCNYRIGLDTALMKKVGVQIAMINNLWQSKHVYHD